MAYAGWEPDVAPRLRKWAAQTSTHLRHIIDARLALTLQHHGVTNCATANVKACEGIGFTTVWNALVAD